ncbi:hypothetical protein BD311DRAFT_803422 [Dichomitus squalens]|uniref:Structure-specific endonuclease subunit SLX4 n=1 Tax=Dichomitus squalens TaxID=114155 RepID=A0A4Q9N0S1_9APHY|nr:hypothetical protein BD311DRAFT_803422 [Dichomitus squalens]
MTRAIPLPSFSRSQSWASQARTDTTEEYVEDSEPERQERRLKAKTRRVQVQRRKTPPAAVVQPAEDVIELTDSSPSRPNTSVPQRIKAKPIVIIDVSDSSDSSAYTPRSRGSDHAHVVVGGINAKISGDSTFDESLPSIGKLIGLPEGKHRNRVKDSDPGDVREGSNPARSSPPSPAPRAPLSFASDEGSDSDEGQLKLKRFAYAAPAPNPPRRTASKTPSPATQESQTPEATSSAVPPAKAKRLPSHRFADEFTDFRLSRLLRCVSCDLAWTARKTVKEKMKHIQSCAKKNRLTDETVRVLLRAELAKLQPVASSSKRNSPVEPTAPSTPETLLAETVREQKKKRAGPRRQVEPTVKSVAETREEILNKARLLLQNAPNRVPPASRVVQQIAQSAAAPVDPEPAMPPPTQAFARSSVAARHDLPDIQPADTTRAFGASRLGVARVQQSIISAGAAIAAESDVSPLTQVFSRSALGSAMAAVDPADDMPPATQAFAPSKLRHASGVAREVLPAHDDPMDEPISLNDASEDDLDLGKSSPPRPTVIEITSSPSSSANHLPPLPTEANLATAPVPAPAVPGHLARSPSPLHPLSLFPEQSLEPAGDDVPEPYAPAYGDDAGDLYVQDDYDHQWNGWYEDQDAWEEHGDAFLHYDPERDGAGPSRTKTQAAETQAPPRERRLLAIPEDDVPGAGPFRVGGEPGPAIAPATKPPSKKRGRPKANTDESDAEVSKEGKEISQEELNAKLKEAILKDEALHLRVLRYEPIHFDVFMQLAAGVGVTDRKTKLRGKVRAFLDEKAIHFYGADPSKNRTKRARHS